MEEQEHRRPRALLRLQWRRWRFPRALPSRELTHGIGNREGDVVAEVQSYGTLGWRK
jgi:hypothetical protein